MLISVSGLIGEGKGTVADYLVKQYGFQKAAFADSLKDATSAIFSWPRYLLEGDTDESREFREEKDEWWSEKLGMNVTPRHILQVFGTEVFRDGFHSDIWLLSAYKKYLESNNDFVFADARFCNELDFVQKNGGYAIVVQRGKRPNWWEIAIEANQGCEYAQSSMASFGVHPSEYKWIGHEFDFEIYNRTTLDSLYNEVDEVMKKIRNMQAEPKKILTNKTSLLI